MAKKNEQGLVQNLVSVQGIISFSKQMGDRYNPANADLHPEKATQKWEVGLLAMDAVSKEYTALQRSINDRRAIFKGLGAFATRIIGALEAAQASEATIQDARYLQRKLSGQRAAKKEEPPAVKEGEEAAVPRTISASQAGFDSKVEHFTRLVMLVTAEPAYKPNEAELSVAGLEQKLTAMKEANAAAILSKTKLNDARARRHEVLFHPKTGLVQMGKQIKAYLKSVFGSNSPEYKQVRGLRLNSRKF